MVGNTNIPIGYKDSVVGIIPQEWEVKKIQDICNVDSKSLSSKTPMDYEFEYISLSDVDSDSFEISTSHQIFRTAPSRARRIVTKGDIVVSTVRPNLKGFFIVKEDKKDLIASTGFAVLTPKESNSEYLLSCFFSQIIGKQFYSLVVGSSYPAVNSSDVARLKLPIPPLAEQKKIAEILCTWDDAIEKQSKLIEKFELRKRGLMQRLLTGKTRLPGFTEPWKKIELGEIGTFLSTNTLSRDKLNSNEGTIKNIHYGDILIKYAEIVNVSNVEIPFINKGVVVSSEYIENGDIVFADTAEDYTVGKAIEIINVNGNKIVAGLHTMLFRPRTNIFVECYLGYYINSEYYQCQLLPLTQGIKVCSITKKGISQTKVLVPEKSEQKAIATVLTSADKEIETQRKKLEALRQQKQGLMQQLLTGKIRVKVS